MVTLFAAPQTNNHYYRWLVSTVFGASCLERPRSARSSVFSARTVWSPRPSIVRPRMRAAEARTTCQAFDEREHPCICGDPENGLKVEFSLCTDVANNDNAWRYGDSNTVGEASAQGAIPCDRPLRSTAPFPRVDQATKTYPFSGSGTSRQPAIHRGCSGVENFGLN